ncbi:nitrogen fixation NifU-like protein [Labedella gwakjiensis]|uniref:Nitrogen fixation NifU-like protein n=1 Tax=Labedella gwakjiensis TaxID=390269 RepID=A0A2P8GWA2_9MICO|nr:SUF system NifU family Fe-S cluster assembly protein [Labedella gwakjiensis]PSL38247.1 nitrogen fixation NifU-like protein [Labedella gwakjiensis]RUQ87214.1 SUF system NifU family Fe-S cluster assembly protein [Labedella gwakjiensis]
MGSPELASLYQQVILDHSKRKNGFGLQDGAAAESHQLNPTCGDEITLRLHLADDDTIERISWEGAGCSISMASASLLHDLVAGLSREEARERIALFREMMRSKGEGVEDDEPLGDAAALEGVSRYVARVKCAMLGWVAFEDTLTLSS